MAKNAILTAKNYPGIETKTNQTIDLTKKL